MEKTHFNRRKSKTLSRQLSANARAKGETWYASVFYIIHSMYVATPVAALAVFGSWEDCTRAETVGQAPPELLRAGALTLPASLANVMAGKRPC